MFVVNFVKTGSGNLMLMVGILSLVSKENFQYDCFKAKHCNSVLNNVFIAMKSIYCFNFENVKKEPHFKCNLNLFKPITGHSLLH